MSSELEKITEKLSCISPEGRELTDDEKRTISSWPFSRKEYFRLCKLYGDPLKIPKEDLLKIHEMALTESLQDNKSYKQVNEKKIDKIDIKFSSMGDSSQPKDNLDYSVLWKEFPRRMNSAEGKRPGLEAAYQRIKTREQFNEALRLIKNYKAVLFRQYNSEHERRSYTKSFSKFIENLEDYFELEDAAEVRPKQKTRKPWSRPFRPLYPWEASFDDTPEVKQEKFKLKVSLTPEKEQEIIKKIQEDVGYNDPNNNDWWYEI